MEEMNTLKHLPAKEFDAKLGELLKKKLDEAMAAVKPKAKKTTTSGKK